MFSRSTDCGATWSKPLIVADNSLNQGAALAVDPNTGAVYMAWRRFKSTGIDRRHHVRQVHRWRTDLQRSAGSRHHYAVRPGHHRSSASAPTPTPRSRWMAPAASTWPGASAIIGRPGERRRCARRAHHIARRQHLDRRAPGQRLPRPRPSVHARHDLRRRQGDGHLLRCAPGQHRRQLHLARAAASTPKRACPLAISPPFRPIRKRSSPTSCWMPRPPV